MSPRRPLSIRIASFTSLFALAVGCSASPPVSRPAPIDDQTGGPITGAGGATSDLKVAGGTDSEPGWGIVPREEVSYGEVVRRVTEMVSDGQTQSAVQRRGLGLMNVMWEDTGRNQGSSVGPNISDLTLQVRYSDHGQNKAALLPVIRFPNFTDRTGDIPANRFFVRMGNQRKGGSLETVALTDVLRDIRPFLSDASSVKGSGNLLGSRDSHFLVSAQAVFLPIPKEGHAQFTPVLFNYQSRPGSPAVLTMLVTRQGTSVTVIENAGDEASPVASWGQELYFNKGGERAPFTAERKSDVTQRIEAQGGPKTEDDRSAMAKGADTLFIVQIPLKHRAPPRGEGIGLGDMGGGGLSLGATAAPPPAPTTASPMKDSAKGEKSRRSDVEQAVLGHGKVEGPFKEGRNFRLERDDRFPIRVTVQFYKATSNGVVNEADLDRIAATIGNVYEHADFVGSLVVPEGDARRPTAWNSGPQLFSW